MSDLAQISLPYFLDGIDFAPNFGPISIRYSQPEDQTPDSQEFRQRTLTVLDDDMSEIVASIMDGICQLLELDAIRRRNPPGRVRSAG